MSFKTNKRVVLHCGANKTGTTATQVSCYRSRDFLSSFGILYPNLGSDALPAQSHWPIAMSFWENPDQYYAMKDGGFSPRDAKEYAQEIKDSFDKQVAETDCNTIFVSSEAIGQMKPDAMARLRDFLDARFDTIEAVYYAREPVAAAMSFLQEYLKAGNEASVKDFINNRTMNFGEVAKRLRDCFGDRVKFKMFDRKTLRDGDILADLLCDEMGLAALPEGITLAGVNQSLSAQAVAFLYFINRNISRRGPNGLDPMFLKTQDCINAYTRKNRDAAKLSFPSDHWKAAILRRTKADWLTFLDLAGFSAEAALIRAGEINGPEPTQAEFDDWMRGNFEGFPMDSIPEDLRILLEKGMNKQL